MSYVEMYLDKTLNPQTDQHVDLEQFLCRMPFLTQPSPISTGLGPALHSWGWERAVGGSVS
ncbi:hypothetical protein EXN66_Car014122 [Channa argus]|uniref:Uncharacterized protein n=1 Tax=Channa argus TaxID=215402 RepID=A0A6G1Q746_CHAAH|nr:hypothetical protein EXN66_Car014122 [Channa argus]